MILLLLAMMWLPHVDSNVEFAMKPLTVQGATSDPKIDSDWVLPVKEVQSSTGCLQPTWNPQQ